MAAQEKIFWTRDRCSYCSQLTGHCNQNDIQTSQLSKT